MTPIERILRLAFRTKTLLGAVLSFMAVLGLFTFPLFILEEATQITIWGTWQTDKNNLYILKEGIDVVNGINKWSKRINKYGGWLHPLSYVSYRGYSQAIDYWIMASQAKIVALDPQLMDGEDLTILFRPQSVTYTKNGALLTNDKVCVITNVREIPEVIWISGKGKWEGEKLTLVNTHRPSVPQHQCD